MEASQPTPELVNKVLLHLYHSVITGNISFTSKTLRISTSRNPRHGDLHALYAALDQADKRLFFEALTAVAEYAVYSTLDFIEHYNRFDSETNTSDYPSLSLEYCDLGQNGPAKTSLSKFGAERLGLAFREIARNPEVRQIVENTISSVSQLKKE